VFKLTFIILACCLYLTPVYADRALIVTSALSAQPDAWAKDNKIVGASVELMRLIFDDLGIPIESKVQPWARSLKELDRGSIDAILTIFYTEERAKFIAYTDPYAFVGTFVFTRRGHELPFKSWDELIGKKGGIIRGDVQSKEFNQFAKEKLDFFAVDNIEQVQKMLVAGRIDYALYSKNPFVIEARKRGLEDKISALPNPISSENLHIGFSKKSPFIKYIPLINTRIAQFKLDGTLSRLTQEAIAEAAEQ